MSNTGSLGELYARIGLNLSDFETDFLIAERTVTENIRRLNRESNLIRVRSEVEIAGLDEVADAERILQIRQEALNRQMEIQRDRVRILDAELQNLARTQGENSVAVQRATLRLERERLTLANLERESRSLNDAQSDTNSSLSDLNSLLPALPPHLKAVGAGLSAIGSGALVAKGAVDELLTNFREIQKQSYELNMPFNKTRDLLREVKLSGVEDIGDLEGYIRGITDAYVKGEADDPEFIALKKYGAVITDNTGRLKDFKDILDEVYQAWKKADEAGEGIEFLQMTGGESGIRDAIQFFKLRDEVEADMAKIMKSSFDASQLHELNRAMNLIEEQSAELKNALGDIFVPVAQTVAEKFFETLHDGTKFLVENKDAIQGWGFVAAEAFNTIGDNVKGAIDTANKNIAAVLDKYNGKTGDSRVDNVLGDMSWRYGGSAKNSFGVDKMIKGVTDSAQKSASVIDGIVERAKQKHAEYNAELAKTKEKYDELNASDGNPLNQYDDKRINQLKDELADLRIDLDIEDEFKRAEEHLKLELDRMKEQNFLSEEEKTAISELGEAKFEQIDRERKKAMEEAEAKIQDYLKNSADIEYEMTHSAFEKQIRDIESWEDLMKRKAESTEEAAAIGAEAAAKEAQAFEREMDRIKGKIQSLDDKIFEQEHSQYEIDLRRAQQERLNYYGEGIYDPNKIEHWFNNVISDLNKRAKESKVSGGDYVKSPNGSLYAMQIPLVADESYQRRQLIQNLDADARATVESIEAKKALADAERNFAGIADMNSAIPAMLQQKFAGAAVSDTTLIAGDQVEQISYSDLKAEMERTLASYAQMPNMSLPGAMPLTDMSMSFETIVTPLNTIAGLVQNILSAMGNQQQPINISPSISNNLGGAYVFDNALKAQLVEDITSSIVDEITKAVQQATSRSNYSYW